MTVLERFYWGTRTVEILLTDGGDVVLQAYPAMNAETAVRAHAYAHSEGFLKRAYERASLATAERESGHV